MEVIQARLPQLREGAALSRVMRASNTTQTGASAELAMPRARKARRPLRAADAPARDRTHLDKRVGDMRGSSKDTKWKRLRRKKGGAMRSRTTRLARRTSLGTSGEPTIHSST